MCRAYAAEWERAQGCAPVEGADLAEIIVGEGLDARAAEAVFETAFSEEKTALAKATTTSLAVESSDGYVLRVRGAGFSYGSGPFPESATRIDDVEVWGAEGLLLGLRDLDRDPASGSDLIAYTRADRVVGSGASQSLMLFEGDDVLWGAGGTDAALYRGRRADYVLSSSQDGSVSVLDTVPLRDGSDTLYDVERIRFSDGVLALDAGGLWIPAPFGTNLTGSHRPEDNILFSSPGVDGAGKLGGASALRPGPQRSDLVAPATDLVVAGGTGADKIAAPVEPARIEGGDGRDDLYLPCASADVRYDVRGSSLVLETPWATHEAVGVERVVLDDGVLAFDVEGAMGQAYRTYQAAFDRVPDIGGLSHWVRVMDAGASLIDIASAFTRSAEFESLYGPDPSHADFVERLYYNVLDRPGEAGGMAFWIGELERGATREHVLASFAESLENKLAVGPAIEAGIWLL